MLILHKQSAIKKLFSGAKIVQESFACLMVSSYAVRRWFTIVINGWYVGLPENLFSSISISRMFIEDSNDGISFFICLFSDISHEIQFKVSMKRKMNLNFNDV